MKFLLGFALALGILAFAPSSLADTKVHLITATSDAYDGSLDISLTVDQNENATGVIYTQAGKDTAVSLANLPTGIVLYQTSGKNAAVLTGKNFSNTIGGPLTLTYLNDGIQNIYKDFNFSLNRVGQAWNTTTLDQNGIPQVFSTLYLVAKKFLGSVIGIDSITAGN